jgi:hypothetical protein
VATGARMQGGLKRKSPLPHDAPVGW